MSYEIINLTLSIVITEIENVLEDYPESPYQVAFSLPEMRQSLLAHVLTHTPNRYAVQGEKLTLKEPKLLRPSPIQERIKRENLIHGGILHLLRENAEWVSNHLTQMENLKCAVLPQSS